MASEASTPMTSTEFIRELNALGGSESERVLAFFVGWVQSDLSDEVRGEAYAAAKTWAEQWHTLIAPTTPLVPVSPLD